MTDTIPEPRLPALSDGEMPPSLQPILAAWPYRLHRTLAHSPASLEAWMPWAEHILRNNRLSPRLREIAILRVAWNARCAYEWGMHAWVGKQVGMTDADLRAVVQGAESAQWTEVEAAIVRGVDELMASHRVSDATWTILARHLAADQLVDWLYVTGQFTTIAWMLNGLRLPPEPGVEPLPTPDAEG
jgi:4-carboxymuconolactone decarboxylase